MNDDLHETIDNCLSFDRAAVNRLLDTPTRCNRALAEHLGIDKSRSGKYVVRVCDIICLYLEKLPTPKPPPVPPVEPPRRVPEDQA